MVNDPFKNFPPLNPRSRKSRKSKGQRGDSFVESIKSIGSSVTDSLKHDVIKDSARAIYDQLLGSAKTGQAPSQELDPTADLQEFIKEREEQAALEADHSARKEERAFHRTHSQEQKILFSFTDEKLKREINEVRQEIALLSKSMQKVEEQLEQAIIQEVVNPGLYHLNFFQRIKSFLITMRKSLEDASLWLQISQSRGKRSHYWNQVKKSGTKYSMSQERSLATSAG